MQTRMISEDEWIKYFDGFSRDHVGWPATIKVMDPDAGPQNLADGLPLEGISFDMKGTRPCTIEISAGEAGHHINHSVDMPMCIREADEPDGSVDIQIEPASGPMTLIHLSGPMQ